MLVSWSFLQSRIHQLVTEHLPTVHLSGIDIVEKKFTALQTSIEFSLKCVFLLFKHPFSIGVFNVILLFFIPSPLLWLLYYVSLYICIYFLYSLA